MDIKEIALKVGLQVFEEHPYDEGHVVSPSGYTWIDDKLIEFAEALIESYKAELLKEVGGPFGFYYEINGTWDAFVVGETEPDDDVYDEGSLKALFTSDQFAAAIVKATKPLEEQLQFIIRECEASNTKTTRIQRIKRRAESALNGTDCGFSGLHKNGRDKEMDELRAKLAAAQEQQQTTFLQLSHTLRIAEDQLAKAEQRVADACAYLAHQHMDADIAADAINNGEWRKFVKEGV